MPRSIQRYIALYWCNSCTSFSYGAPTSLTSPAFMRCYIRDSLFLLFRKKVIQSFVFDLSIKNKSNGLFSPYHVVVAILLVMGGENWSNLIPSRKGWHLACALYFSDVTCVARAWGRETLGLKSVKCPTMGGKNGPWGLIDYTTIDQHSASCQNYTMLCWFWGCIDNVEVQSLATLK